MEGAHWSVFWIPALFWSGFADTCLKICFLNSTNIYYTCENISTDRGYTLRVPEIVPFECMTRCEHGWYNKNDTFLVDVQNSKSGHLSDLVAEVTHWNLTTRSCLDKAYWKMDCHCSSNAILVTSYMAVETLKNVDEEKGTNGEKFHLLWLLCIPVFALLVWYCKKKGITEAALHWAESYQADRLRCRGRNVI